MDENAYDTVGDTPRSESGFGLVEILARLNRGADAVGEIDRIAGKDLERGFRIHDE